MEPLLFYASIIICILCFQNIYVQVKRNGFVLIWYSVSNSLLSLAYVICGITLHNDFSIENATTYEKVFCGIGGLILSLSSIANAGLALALSVELFVSLRLTNPAARQDPRIIRLNVILAFVMPVVSISASIMILLIDGNNVFTNIDDGGICEVSRHGNLRGILFVIRTLPEYLPIYPSCILSVLALIPVAQKVFENRRLQNSLSIPWAIENNKETVVSILPTRGGPPPNPSIPPNARMLLPRNVLLRMGLWCCLLIIFGIPTSIILLKTNIECLITGVVKLNYLPDIDVVFWKRNGNVLHMVFIMALFLFCFGTGKFANAIYCELWAKIFDIIFCRFKPLKHKSRPSEFDRNITNRVSPVTTAQSYISLPPPTHTSNSYYASDIIHAINNNDCDCGGASDFIMINEIARPKDAVKKFERVVET